MVALAVLTALPLAWTIARLIQAHDEFSRRVHIVALAVAFTASVLLVVAADFLQRAGFVGDLSLSTIWIGMLVIWWFSIFVTTRYYQ
jgi:hypothetical protein